MKRSEYQKDIDYYFQISVALKIYCRTAAVTTDSGVQTSSRIVASVLSFMVAVSKF